MRKRDAMKKWGLKATQIRKIIPVSTADQRRQLCLLVNERIEQAFDAGQPDTPDTDSHSVQVPRSMVEAALKLKKLNEARQEVAAQEAQVLAKEKVRLEEVRKRRIHNRKRRNVLRRIAREKLQARYTRLEQKRKIRALKLQEAEIAAYQEKLNREQEAWRQEKEFRDRLEQLERERIEEKGERDARLAAAREKAAAKVARRRRREENRQRRIAEKQEVAERIRDHNHRIQMAALAEREARKQSKAIREEIDAINAAARAEHAERKKRHAEEMRVLRKTQADNLRRIRKQEVEAETIRAQEIVEAKREAREQTLALIAEQEEEAIFHKTQARRNRAAKRKLHEERKRLRSEAVKQREIAKLARIERYQEIAKRKAVREKRMAVRARLDLSTEQILFRKTEIKANSPFVDRSVRIIPANLNDPGQVRKVAEKLSKEDS
jgi:hypothetical protein